MEIPKGFPKSVGRVGSRHHGFPCFPYSVISMACFLDGKCRINRYAGSAMPCSRRDAYGSQCLHWLCGTIRRQPFREAQLSVAAMCALLLSCSCLCVWFLRPAEACLIQLDCMRLDLLNDGAEAFVVLLKRLLNQPETSHSSSVYLMRYLRTVLTGRTSS